MEWRALQMFWLRLMSWWKKVDTDDEIIARSRMCFFIKIMYKTLIVKISYKLCSQRC